MKEIIRNIKIKDITAAVRQLGLPEDATVDLTIDQGETAQAVMEIVNEIRTYAKKQGLTEAKLEELLADES